MNAYASLVKDDKVREIMMGIILEELRKTREMFEIILEKPISERRKQHWYSNVIRATAMDNLHKKQIMLLKTWREQKQQGNLERAEKTHKSLLLTINAIAGALRSTG
jgi:phosphoenolpyruvate carboxylase